MNNDNLTESQRRLVAAMRREMVQVSDEIMEKIEQLRRENDALHQAHAKRQEDFFATIRRNIRSHAFGLLGLVGVGDDEVDDWAKRKHK